MRDDTEAEAGAEAGDRPGVGGSRGVRVRVRDLGTSGAGPAEDTAEDTDEDAAEDAVEGAVEPSPEAGSSQPQPQPQSQGRRSDAGFYLFGVGRTRGWRGRGEGEEVLRVRYRDLEALVRAVPYKLPGLDVTHVQAHQRTVESIMRRGTILPAPYGVVFRGRRALVRFLEDQYLALDEGLAFLEGHWEVRVHAAGTGTDEPTGELEELAVHIYADLRRSARAAIPLPRDGHRLLSAAFLVERGAWIEFVNRAEDLVGAHPALTFDITGPWPPYDFVRMSA